MTYVDQEDGLTKLSLGEEYHVTGYVTIKVWVDYSTSHEPGDDEKELDDAVRDIVGSDDYEIIESEGLDYEVE